MPAKRRHAWLGFALTAALGLVSVFMLHGVASGVTSLVTILASIGACTYALRGYDRETIERNDRAGVRGFVGHWF